MPSLNYSKDGVFTKNKDIRSCEKFSKKTLRLLSGDQY